MLHYRDNNRQMHDGDLLLIDAGCEFQRLRVRHHAHVPGQRPLQRPQQAIYELVLAAQLACIDAVKPGAPFHDYHQAAERVLAQGLIDLGLCRGTLDDVLESGSYKQFYMHRTGHWLGMDVHDAGVYQQHGESMRLAPGMVLTVEPGAYIRPADNVPEAFWNIGVRIEDDVLVTAGGVENLTAATPEDRSPTSKPPARRLTAIPRAARARAKRFARCTDVVIVGAGPSARRSRWRCADADLDVVVVDGARPPATRRGPIARSRCRTARG